MKSKIKQNLRLLLGSLLIASINAVAIFAEDLDWPKHGLNAQESRFSPIKQIQTNVVLHLILV